MKIPLIAKLKSKPFYTDNQGFLMHWSMVLIFILIVVEVTASIVVTLFTSLVILFCPSLRSKYIHMLMALLFLSHTFSDLMQASYGTCHIINCNQDAKIGVGRTRSFFFGLAFWFTLLVSSVRFLSVYKPFFYQNLTQKHGIAAIFGIIISSAVITVWDYILPVSSLFYLL